MDKIIFNSLVQGTLSIVFAVLVIIVVVAALVVMARAVRSGGLPTSEVEAAPSRIFAPSGPIPTPEEKAVLAEWKNADLDPSPAATGGHRRRPSGTTAGRRSPSCGASAASSAA